MIALQSLQVGGLYVTKRSEGWVVEATPGLVWSTTDGWIFEPSQPDELFIKNTRYDTLEKAIEIALVNNSDLQRMINTQPDEYELPSSSTKPITSCVACGQKQHNKLCKVGMKLQLPVRLAPDPETVPQLTFVGPLHICQACLAEFMGAFKRGEEEQLGKASKGTKIILDLLNETITAAEVGDSATYEILLSTSRFLYPLLIWLKKKLS